MSVPRPRSNTQQLEQGDDPFENGLLFYRQKEWVRAYELFNKALLAKPSAEAYFYKGMTEARIPELRKEGVKSLQMAVAQSPQNAKYHTCNHAYIHTV